MNRDTADEPKTAQEEYDFYADPANQAPQGPPVRRRSRLSDPVPVRLPLDVLEEVRQRAQADDRSVSSWVRRAVEHELHRSA
jgi:predicted HicB family RNase H-like nuclease